MTEERRKRQEEPEGEQRKPRLLRTILIAALIVATFAAAYALGRWKRGNPMDDFAKCLTAKQVKMYGLYWCAHCAEQKEAFGDSFQYVSYIECGIRGSHAAEPVCVEAGVKNFPTWQFPDGSRLEGKQEFKVLSEKSGCPLP